MITLDDLKDFSIWKQWIHGEVELGEPKFQTEGMSDDDIANWKRGFIHGANWMLKSKETL